MAAEKGKEMKSVIVWTLAIIAAPVAIVLIAIVEAVKLVCRGVAWMVATPFRFLAALVRAVRAWRS